MLFVIIAFTGITLIYAAIVFAVWFLPKEVKPPIDIDALSPKQRVIRVVLMVITGVYALLLIPACFVSFVSPFVMVSPGSEQEKFVAFLYGATLPFTITSSIIMAWILFRRRSENIALFVIMLPIVQFLVSLFIPGIWSSL
jgi:hypothetical protein